MNASLSLANRKYFSKVPAKPRTPEVIISYNDAAGCWMAELGDNEYLATQYREVEDRDRMIQFIRDVFSDNVTVIVNL